MAAGPLIRIQAARGGRGVGYFRQWLLLVGWALVGLAALAGGTPEAAAQTRYLAFGDSITEGVGDDPDRPEKGYPPRLEALLAQQGVGAQVENHGRGGERTIEGLTRIDQVLAGGGDVLLLMEGTNDISVGISPDTTAFNLREMARKAAQAGLATVHATVVPRLPTARVDEDNRLTARLAAEIRELAWAQERSLADPFAVFSAAPDALSRFYTPTPGDPVGHPNAAGYDQLARVFADVLLGSDTVPPVPGEVAPPDGAEGVPPMTELRVVLYDFGTGIDTASATLVLDGHEVPASVTGDSERLVLSFRPPEPLVGRIRVGIRARDRAAPPNTTDRVVTDFLVAGTAILVGDIDRNGRVDGVDLVALARGFGALRGEPRFERALDLNRDGAIDGQDLAILARDFGQRSF